MINKTKSGCDLVPGIFQDRDTLVMYIIQPLPHNPVELISVQQALRVSQKSSF